jgi:hypothetical protein
MAGMTGFCAVPAVRRAPKKNFTNGETGGGKRFGRSVRTVVRHVGELHARIVRAHRWRRQIESGKARSVTDLAEQAGVTVAYVCRLLPPTCLAPDIVVAILDGQQPKGLRLADMLGSAALTWHEQRVSSGFGFPGERALVMSDGGPLGALRQRAWPTAGTEAIRSATVVPANETNGSGPAIF